MQSLCDLDARVLPLILISLQILWLYMLSFLLLPLPSLVCLVPSSPMSSIWYHNRLLHRSSFLRTTHRGRIYMTCHWNYASGYRDATPTAALRLVSSTSRSSVPYLICWATSRLSCLTSLISYDDASCWSGPSTAAPSLTGIDAVAAI